MASPRYCFRIRTGNRREPRTFSKEALLLLLLINSLIVFGANNKATKIQNIEGFNVHVLDKKNNNKNGCILMILSYISGLVRILHRAVTNHDILADD